MAEETDPSAPARPAFHVGWAARVVLIAGAALSGLLALSGSGAREIGVVVGTVVAAVGLPLLVGWVVFRLGGRSAANPVIVGVAVVSVCGSMSRQAERRQAEENLGDSLRALKDRRMANDPEGRAKAANDAIGALEKLGETDTRNGDDMLVMARMLRGLQEPTQELQALAEEFQAAGGVMSTSLPTLAAIDARLELAGRIRARAEALRDKVKTFVADAEAELRHGGVDPQVIDGFLSAAREQGERLELTRELRESDIRYFAACQQILTLFRTHHGAWRSDPKSGSLVFDKAVPRADLEIYTRAAETIEAEAAAQVRLEQRIAGGGR